VHKHITVISLLLSEIFITIMTATIGISSINPNQLAYADNYVAASFITRIDQIRVQTQLVENNIALNFSLAKQHAKIASQLFDNNTQNDLYYNAEGNNGLAEEVSDEIPLALSNLQKAVEVIAAGSLSATANQSKQPQQHATTTTSNTVIKQVKEIVNNINNILDKAVSVRVDKYDLANSTVHALVLADITEKAYNDYSYAYGIKPVMFSGSSSPSSMMMNNMNSSSMSGMMMMTGSSPNTSSNSTRGSTMKQLATANHDNNNGDSNRTVVNITAYQQAQGLATRALQIFNNDLKPTSLVTGSITSVSASSASTNTNTIADISKIENNLMHLKNAIDSKTSITDVMKIVHGEIHPALLTSYNLLVSNTPQIWTDKSNNIKIQFSYLPELPTADDIIQLQFSIQNLQTGSRLKDLIAYVTVSNEPLYKFNNITATDGNFSIRCPFLDPGIHQVILKVNSKDYSLALASFNISIA
jgi:hypothetical protein